MTVSAPMQAPPPERPLSTLDLADGALAILRSKPRTVATIAAAFVLPTHLLTAWLDREFFAVFDLGEFDSTTGQFEGQSELADLGIFGASTIGTILQHAILPFLGVALTHLALGWRMGHDRSASECLAFTLRKTHVILVALVLSKLIQGASLLLATPVTMLVAPIIAAENVGPVTAIRRAFVLGRRRYGALLGLLLLIVLIHVLLGNALATVPVVGALFLGEWGWVAFFALGSVGATVLDILGTGAAVLAYIDVTNRTEGTDLVRRLRFVQSGG